LLDRGVFEIVDKNCIPKNARLFGSRFVDTVKNQGTEKAFEKSRLVQAYNDNVKKTLLTQSPTIQRSSQRLALSFFVTLPDVNIYLRDISQAYTQSKSSLARDFFIRAPEEMGLTSNMVLKVVLPLYGIPEAGTHWFYTYQKHHIDMLNMKLSTFDPCLLFNENQSAIIGLQTDDSLIVATPSFMEIEEQKLIEANLLSKPIEKLGVDHPLEFNGFMITLNKSNNICITQKKQLEKIKLLGKDFTNEEYIAQRARGAYIATVSQPEASFCLSYAAQITNPTYDDAQFLNRCLKWQLQGRGLNFVKLDQQSLPLITFTDSSFANNRDNSSQIGYVIVLTDRYNNANIIHWQSVKCRRVTRSVLASELYALSLGFDISTTIKSTLDQICCNSVKRKIPLTLCVDSKSLYDCLVKLGTTQEKRLMIDLPCLRQSYERREITEILWIRGINNPADALTKEKPCNALQRLIETNKIDLEINGWMERENNLEV
ncbi:hypothetical protein K3495_g14878, partial [Podosphaera aphanis]